MIIRAVCFVIIGLLALAALITAGDPPEYMIEPTPAHACLPTPPPLLGPKPGDPIFGKRKESAA